MHIDDTRTLLKHVNLILQFVFHSVKIPNCVCVCIYIYIYTFLSSEVFIKSFLVYTKIPSFSHTFFPQSTEGLEHSSRSVGHERREELIWLCWPMCWQEIWIHAQLFTWGEKVDSCLSDWSTSQSEFEQPWLEFEW